MADAVRKRRRIKLQGAALLAVVVGVTVATWSARRPTPPSAPKLPVPNGYDDLVRAGQQVQGTWPNQGNFAKADVAEVRAFVEANRTVLDLARVGLARECLVPLVEGHDGLARHLEVISPIRSAGRMLLGEAVVAEADGRIVDASKAYRDMLAMGQAVTQGGLILDQTVGAAIQGQAIVGLRQLCGRLPRAEIPAILRDLEALDRRRVPVEDVEARELAWYQATYSLPQRTIMSWSGMEAKARAATTGVIRTARLRLERDLHYLIAGLAIHAYHEDKGAWPRSLVELAPAYLAAVPHDPNTGKPLDYPADLAGELTDDLASIARPDGEVAAPRP